MFLPPAAPRIPQAFFEISSLDFCERSRFRSGKCVLFVADGLSKAGPDSDSFDSAMQFSPSREFHRRSWSVALRVSLAGLRVTDRRPRSRSVTVTVAPSFQTIRIHRLNSRCRFVLIMMATPRPRPPGIQPSLILEVVATEPGPGSVVS